LVNELTALEESG